MAVKNPGMIKKWVYVPLALLLLVVLFLGIFALTSRTRTGLTFAAEKKEGGENKTADDANAQSEQRQKASADDNKVLPPDHNHPAFDERVVERARMVAKDIQGGWMREGVRDPNVLAAMRTVPRHAFVRRGDLHRAYADRPLPIGLNQTISQPYIVAYMTHVLKLRPDSRVFEVGTGSGYQAAVCAEIAKEVYTVEIIEKLAKSAKERLKELGYRNVTVKAADGYYGWEEKGPFDAIIVTAAATSVPPPLVKQLKPGGRMILPKGSPYGAQWLVLITKDDKGKVRSRRLMGVRFVPMTGRIMKVKEPPKK
ncbi:MAG: protein-L-isoaspartate(D-aspartate) O-methyltransferase [Planctomycetota bacterium]|jgi:protein-L-isoaspartate(D-aspartate) O-methyltransferase